MRKFFTHLTSLALAIAFAFTLTVSSSASSLDSALQKQTIQNTLDNLATEIPSDELGGIYLDQDNNIVVNLVQGTYKTLPNTIGINSSAKVIYNNVDYSLAKLESVHQALVPYMQEYDIAVLDANDVTNMLDIEVYSLKDGLTDLVKEYIDMDHVNITVLPEDTTFDLTAATEEPETSYMSIYAVSAQVNTIATIYPGAVIRVGTSQYCTAGPRISSSAFYTCGHAPASFTNRNQSVYMYNSLTGYSQIGSTSNVVFGSYGDRSNVDITASAASLPASNRFLTGSGTYTYSTAYVGCAVEMHGAYSGITSGTVNAVNQTVNVSGTSVGNLARASYTCIAGDSGAGVFSANAMSSSSSYCYGIQSAGSVPSGSTYTVCYFSQF